MVEDRDTILELICKIQELQNEINRVNHSIDFQDAESIHSKHSHVTSQFVSYPPHPVLGGMLSRSVGMPSRKDGPPTIWGTHVISGNVLANPAASSSAPCPRGIESMEFSYIRTNSLFTGGEKMRIKHQFRIRDASPDRQPKVQSSFVRWILQRIFGQTNNDCRSQIFVLTNSPRQQPLFVGR